MLRAAARVRRAPHPVVSAEFRARARARLAAITSAEPSPLVPQASRFERRRTSWWRPIATPIAAALGLVLVVGGIGTASASALPGTPLYPAKLAVEHVRLLVASSPEQQAQTHLEIASTRLQEAAIETRRGDPEAVTALLQSYQQQVEAAERAAARSAAPAYHQQIAREVAALRSEQKKVIPATIETAGHPNAGNGRAAEASRPRGADEVNGPAGHPETGRPGASGKDHGEKGRSKAEAGSDLASPSPSPASGTTAGPAASVNLPAPSDGSPGNPPPSGPSEQLVKTLIAQALSGDTTGSTATARAYLQVVGNERLQGEGAINRLRGQQAQLEHALARAPSSTRSILQDTLRALGAALANAADSDTPPTGWPPTSDHPGNGVHGGDR